MKNSLQFKLISQEPDLYGVWGERDTVEFDAAGIRFRLIDSNERPHDGIPHRSIEAIATRELNEAAFVALITYEANQTRMLSNIDNFTPSEHADPEIAVLVEHIRRNLTDAIQRVVEWITWKHNLVPENELWPRRFNVSHGDGEKRLYFRLSDGDEWTLAPIDFDRSTENYVGKTIPEALDDVELAEMLDTLGNDENQAPLGWSMFELAIRMLGDRRVALVLASAAAEVATKECLVRLDGSTLSTWFLIEKPAPSWLDLVGKALPRVTSVRTSDNPDRVLPREMIDSIWKGIALRNAFVHRGAALISDDELEDFMIAVNDLLYALEWIQGGGDWALENVSARRRGAWN